MEYGFLLRLVGVVDLILILFIHSIVKGENPTEVISFRK